VRRDTAPSREAGEESATSVGFSVTGSVTSGYGAKLGTDESCQGSVIPQPYTVANCLTQRMHKGINTTLDEGQTPVLAHSLRGEGFDASEDGTGRGTPLVPVAHVETMPTMTAGGPSDTSHNQTSGQMRDQYIVPVQPVTYDFFNITAPVNRRSRTPGDPCHTLARSNAEHAVVIKPVAFHPTQDPISSENVCHSIGANDNATAAVVSPVRYGNHQQDTLHHESGIMSTLPGGSNDNAGHYTNTVTAMQVRRLTPVECERLQGFPTVLETVKIQACIDHQNSVVRAAIQCRRLQNNAWSAGESESQPNVKTAAASLITHQADREPLAALHVRMHSVDELLEVRSLGRLIWSANGVGASSKSLPPTLTGNTAQELARLLREAAHSARSGKVASPQNISLSFPASSGATSAEKSGQEMAASASGVTSGQKQATFTTSDLGRITTSCDSTAATLCCFALHAIAGCIPSTTLPETFSIELTVETPYTAIPWRNKPASECPDGPRYKALGNSWAVPCVRWIGRRIHNAVAGRAA